MMVKAKFFIGGVEINSVSPEGWRAGGPKSGKVRMGAVCRGAVNKTWAQSTPSGTFEMYVNGPAVAWFLDNVGKEVSITIDLASNDPATHPFVPLPDEVQPSEEDQKHGYRLDETCSECGQPEGAHR